MAALPSTTLFDALIVGGGPTGLAAALALARATRTAVVFDNQIYRNARATHMHTVSTWDHRPPAEYRAAARQELVSRYNTVRLEDVGIKRSKKTEKGMFQLVDDHGREWMGRKLILATGVRDIMLDIEGYEDCWGRSVFHCLFCHGYENKGAASSGVLYGGDVGNAAVALHLGRHARALSRKVTIYTNDSEAFGTEVKAALRPDEDILIDNRKVKKLINGGGEYPSVTIQFEDGSNVTEGFIASRPKTEVNGNFVQDLSLEMDGMGSIKTADMFMKTNVPGVFAAGDCGTVMKSVVNAIATGTAAGAVVSAELNDEGPVSHFE